MYARALRRLHLGDQDGAFDKDKGPGMGAAIEKDDGMVPTRKSISSLHASLPTKRICRGHTKYQQRFFASSSFSGMVGQR